MNREREIIYHCVFEARGFTHWGREGRARGRERWRDRARRQLEGDKERASKRGREREGEREARAKAEGRRYWDRGRKCEKEGVRV